MAEPSQIKSQIKSLNRQGGAVHELIINRDWLDPEHEDYELALNRVWRAVCELEPALAYKASVLWPRSDMESGALACKREAIRAAFSAHDLVLKSMNCGRTYLIKRSDIAAKPERHIAAQSQWDRSERSQWDRSGHAQHIRSGISQWHRSGISQRHIAAAMRSEVAVALGRNIAAESQWNRSGNQRKDRSGMDDDHAYKQGFRAYQDGLYQSENPYEHSDPILFRAWDAGFHEAHLQHNRSGIAAATRKSTRVESED
jgi:hypothetical protein